jgi:hypothetical protein
MASPSGGDQVGVALEQLNAHLLRLGYELPHSMAAEVRALPPSTAMQMLSGLTAPHIRSPVGYLRHRLAQLQRVPSSQTGASSTQVPAAAAVQDENEEYAKRVKREDEQPPHVALGGDSSHSAPGDAAPASVTVVSEQPDSASRPPERPCPPVPAEQPQRIVWTVQGLQLGHRCCPGCGEQSDVGSRNHDAGMGAISVRARPHQQCGTVYCCTLKRATQHGSMIMSQRIGGEMPRDWPGAGRHDIVADHAPHCFVCGVRYDMIYSAPVMNFVHVVQMRCPICDGPYTGSVVRQGDAFIWSYAGSFGDVRADRDLR